VQPARDGQKQALQMAIKVIDQRVNANRAALSNARTEQRKEVSSAEARITEIENRANQKENSYKASLLLPGCSTAVGVIIGWSLFLNAMVNRTGSSNPGLLLIIISFVVGVLWNPIMREIKARRPARMMRSQIPQLKRDLEEIKSDSETRLSQKTSALDAELSLLTQQKVQCQEALART
jgi:hypothetical protein